MSGDSGERIIEWIFNDSKKVNKKYQGIMKGPYTNRKTLAQQLEELESIDVSTKRMIDNIGGAEVVISSKQNDIDTANERWQQNKFDEINKADTTMELKRIRASVKDDRGANDEDYEDEYEKEVIKELDAKESTLKDKEAQNEQSEKADDLRDRISKAESSRELARLDEERIGLDDITLRRELKAAVEARQAELNTSTDEEVRREFTKRISSASKLDDLTGLYDDIRKNTVTTPAEEYLLNLLERKRKQLGG